MKILLPLNGTPKSESIIPFVTNLALRWKAEVLALTVIDPVGGAGDPIVPLVTEGFYREKVAAGEEYIQSIPARFGSVPVQPFCRIGSPEHCMANLAREEKCDMIVLATHGHSGFVRWFCGSVAEGLLRVAPCPVLLVRKLMPIQFRQVLIPVDGSEASRQVARLIPGPFLSPETGVTELHCAEPVVEEILDWLETHDCELICMATHGREGLEHLLHGSITEEVARASDCPVLVFPPVLVPKADVCR